MEGSASENDKGIREVMSRGDLPPLQVSTLQTGGRCSHCCCRCCCAAAAADNAAEDDEDDDDDDADDDDADDDDDDADADADAVAAASRGAADLAAQGTSSVQAVASRDGGETWDPPEVLLSKPGAFLKNHPLMSLDGRRWLLPMYYTPQARQTPSSTLTPPPLPSLPSPPLPAFVCQFLPVRLSRVPLYPNTD